MLAAVEMWVKPTIRRNGASGKMARFDRRQREEDRRGDGAVEQPGEGLSNRTPRLVIQWDGAKLGITGQELSKLLLDSDPRIVLASGSGTRGGNMASLRLRWYRT